MKLLSLLASANATLAALSALLGAAPFTPAILLFFAFAPLAALFSVKSQTVASLVVVFASGLAWLLTPLRHSKDAGALQAMWLTWVVVWSVLVICFSRKELLALLVALRGGNVNGA